MLYFDQSELTINWQSNIMNLSYWYCFRIFNTNFFKKVIICPRWMNTMIGFFFTEIIPFFYFLYDGIFIVFFAESLIVNICDTLDNNRMLMGESVVSYLLSFTKSFGKIYSWTDSSLSWWFKTVLNYKISVLFACSMINYSSLWAISREMISIRILANSAKVVLMFIFTTFNFAHQKSIK